MDEERLDLALKRIEDYSGDLTAQECEELREVLRIWRGLRALGKIGKALIWIVVSAGAVVGVARSSGAVEWLAGWFGK